MAGYYRRRVAIIASEGRASVSVFPACVSDSQCPLWIDRILEARYDPFLRLYMLLGCPMRRAQIPSFLLLAVSLITILSAGFAHTRESLPAEPDESSRLDEQYDHESRMFYMLYSLKGNGEVDYVTARSVQDYSRSAYGNPVYYTERFPILYYWNHTMWNDPEMDGVNGNERVYQENIDFDIGRFKPCTFNGQPC